MKIGLHVDTVGGYDGGVDYVARLGCTSMQIFSSNPKTYRVVPPDVAALERFAQRRRAAGIATCAIHTSYLINLASGDTKIAHGSLNLLSNDLKTAVTGGIDFVNTHLGSYGTRERSEGFASVVELLERALEHTAAGTYLIMENSAGAGQLCGGTLEELGEFVRALDHPQLGVCLDTAHSWAAGYAIDGPDGVERFLDLAERTVSLERVRMFHFNDTQIPLGAHKDRHWHIGEGNIGFAGFRALVAHPALAGKTAILETPGDESDDARNVASLHSLLAGSAAARA